MNSSPTRSGLTIGSPLSTADVEDLLAERGVIISRETIRLWVNRFSAHFAACIRRDRPQSNDKWHLDEVVSPINGVKHWLWRAVDANGDVLDILVQGRRNAKAAKRFMARLITQFGPPGLPSQTNCAATLSRSRIKHRTPITVLTKGSTIASKGVTGRRDDEGRSWGGSSRHGKRSASSPHMTRSTISSALAVTASLPHHNVMPGQMHSVSGLTMPPK